MPLRYFYCPDKRKINIAECLKHCPCTEGRCLSLPTLLEISWERPIGDTFSTTQLLNGTRMEYLKITQNYCINPYERAFALLGTRHHRQLDKIAKKLNALSEEKLQGEVSGILDLLVPDETTEEERYELWDYKTSGSYKVALALKAEAKDWVLQLNNYRIMVEECGFPVSRMINQATVRDGGTYIAKQRGLDKNIYLISVRRLLDDEVRQYFVQKDRLLRNALENKKLPPLCSKEETWEGRRCKKYCDVRELCKKG